ncbi:DUF2533 family protein [Bacillus spongiae]|uniref:DUF2533 family protein n=1 Tax=Bacillus spongiae TaxID=2683610 RepID=A0ABU8HAT4_9BACI
MSVHKAITKLTKKHNEIASQFATLEQQREVFISEAIHLCQQNKSFTTNKINSITNEMNELAKSGVVPQRKLVSEEMVKEYVGRLNQS